MGAFIVIEGIECSGKTTQVRDIVHALREKGHDAISAREPGESEIGEKIRALLKDSAYTRKMDPFTSLYLFNASRRQFITEVVAPALKKGSIVVSDRFLLSTIAYQGYAEGLPLGFVREVCSKTAEGYLPRKTFWLDISVDEMKKRLAQRSLLADDRYDQMEMAFHEKVRRGYLAEWAQDQTNIERIDAERPPEVITAELVQKILSLVS